MAITVSTGLGTLKSSLAEVIQRMKQGFNLSSNTPRIMVSSGDTFFHSAARISEGLSIAINQVRVNWGTLKEKGNVGELRLALSELRNLKAYFDYIKKNKKLPEPGWIREGKAKYNNEKMIPYVAAVIQKIPISL